MINKDVMSLEKNTTNYKQYTVNNYNPNTDIYTNDTIFISNICKKTLPCKHEIYSTSSPDVIYKNIIEIAEILGVSTETADISVHKCKINSKLYENLESKH